MKAEFKMLYNGVPQYISPTDEWKIDLYEAIADTNVIDMAMAEYCELAPVLFTVTI